MTKIIVIEIILIYIFSSSLVYNQTFDMADIAQIRSQLDEAEFSQTEDTIDTLRLQSFADRSYSVGGLGFSLINPRGQFADKIENNAYGLYFDFGHKFENSPIASGMDFAYHLYDYYSFNYDLLDENEEAVYSFSNINVFLRFMADDDIIIPYFELVGGFGILASSYYYDTDDYLFGESADSDTELSGTWNYGLGGGIFVPFSTIVNEDGAMKNLMLELQARMIFGTMSNYRSNTELEYVDDFVFDWIRSSTNHFSFRIGFAFRY